MAGAAGLIGPVIGAGASILGGSAAGRAAEAQAQAQATGDFYQAQQEYINFQEGQLKATETSTAMTDRLTRTMGTVMAIRGGMGANPASPTGAAIENRIFGQGSQDIQRTVQNMELEATQHLLASSYYWQAGFTAQQAGAQAASIDQTAGVLKGIAGIAGGLGGLFG